MFVGETGIGRIVERACELMKQHDTEDLRPHGGIDLAMLQRYLNFHFSVSIDLFGSEISSNAANYYTMGLKGRYQETKRDDDHRLNEATYPVLTVTGGQFETVQAQASTALNELLRDDYVTDCERGVRRWNQIIERHGIDAELRLPHRAFHRQIGSFTGLHCSPDGKRVDAAEWQKRQADWLPTADDHRYIASLMTPVTEPGKFANWLAPPARGIHGRPIDFEYVRFDA